MASSSNSLEDTMHESMARIAEQFGDAKGAESGEKKFADLLRDFDRADRERTFTSYPISANASIEVTTSKEPVFDSLNERVVWSALKLWKPNPIITQIYAENAANIQKLKDHSVLRFMYTMANLDSVITAQKVAVERGWRYHMVFNKWMIKAGKSLKLTDECDYAHFYFYSPAKDEIMGHRDTGFEYKHMWPLVEDLNPLAPKIGLLLPPLLNIEWTLGSRFIDL